MLFELLMIKAQCLSTYTKSTKTHFTHTWHNEQILFGGQGVYKGFYGISHICRGILTILNNFRA